MSRFSKSASVVANPWFALDHKGRPCGVIPVEPREVGGHLGFVGVKVDRDKSTASHKARGQVVPTAQDTVYVFSDKPVRVPRTPYYRELVKQGSLFAADASTAAWAGLKFVAPEVRIAEAKTAAETRFELEYGEGSLADLRRADPPVPQGEAASDVASPGPGSPEPNSSDEGGAPDISTDDAAADSETNTSGAARRKGKKD